MQLSNGEIFTLIAMAAGVVIWLVRLEGRVNLNERLLSERIDKLKEDVGYIRKSIDLLVRRRGTDTDDDDDGHSDRRREILRRT